MWSPSRIAAQREAKRKSSAFVFLNLWPFAAIMVALVAMFMLRIRPHDGYSRGSADLPKSQSGVRQPDAGREDAIRILVSRDGAIYLNNTETQLRDLAPAVQSAIRGGAEKKVYLSADARAKNGDVERVVDELQRAGISQISIITE